MPKQMPTKDQVAVRLFEIRQSIEASQSAIIAQINEANFLLIDLDVALAQLFQTNLKTMGAVAALDDIIPRVEAL